MKPSKKRLRVLIREEKQASKMYRKYGYKKLAKDESSHKRYLQRQLKK